MLRFFEIGCLLLAGCVATLSGADAAPLNPRYTGVPFMQTWRAEDYGASPSTRGVVQDPRTGFMYFANAGGLLEYDGVRWRLFPLPGGVGMGDLAIDAQGRVRFHTEDVAGWLAADALGDRHAVAIDSGFPAGEALSSPLGPGVDLGDGMYHSAGDRLVRFSHTGGTPPHAWRLPNGETAGPLWMMAGALHIRGSNHVFRFDGERFHEVAGLHTAAFVTRPDPAGGWQMVNRDGVRRWADGYRPVAAGLPALVSPLEGDIALNAVYLADGRIAFGTTRSGIIIADPSGRRLQKIDRVAGLLSNRVESLCPDREGGLWATFRNGIARLQVDSPFVRHGAGARRIEGTPTALMLHRGELYVGGGEGLWRRDRDGEFHGIAGVASYVRGLVSLDDELFVTGLELRRVLPTDQAELIGQACFGLERVTTAPGFVVRGTNDGLAFDRADGPQWRNAGRLEGISGSTALLCEWPAGVMWAANSRGLWRADLRGGVRSAAPVKNYRAPEGVPAALSQYNAELFAWGGGLAGVIAGKFLRYDEAADRWTPETRIEGMPRDPDGGVSVWLLGSRPDAEGRLWLQLRGPAAPLVQIVPNGPDRWRALRPPGPALTHYFGTAIRHDAGLRTLWLAGNGMLLSRDLDWQPGAPPPPPVTMIRRVEQTGGKLIWADGAPSAQIPRLQPGQNGLRIHFTSPTYVGDYLGRMHTHFRTRLEGLDEDWTPWSQETQRDFTNLPFRDFVFRVQARDDQGRESDDATLAFSIAPPWWLNRWAFSGYAALGLLGVVGLVRWRTRVLRRRAENLEAIVALRTEDLRQSNAELARLHAIERDEKLAARLDEEKARLEMLRYQLNPHFLYNSLASICGTARTNPEGTRTMAQRLANFCRLTLTRADETQPVAEELRMLQAYLEIEKARWRDNLQIEIDVPEAALSQRLPTFLLLPLIENAIKHGGRTTRETLRVRIAITTMADHGLDIEIGNTGVWDTVTPNPDSTGIGLENIRRRLHRYYPNAHEFIVKSTDGWVSVRLRLAARSPNA